MWNDDDDGYDGYDDSDHDWSNEEREEEDLDVHFGRRPLYDYDSDGIGYGGGYDSEEDPGDRTTARGGLGTSESSLPTGPASSSQSLSVSRLNLI